MATVNDVSNSIMSTYGTSVTGSKYDAHKKSELRSTYNTMLKVNKEAPLYKINLDNQEVSSFAIDVKESARNAKLVIADIQSNGDSVENLLSKKIAFSSDENSVSVEYVGNGNDSDSDSFEIEVDSLAKSQINIGRYLAPKSHDFEEGHYTFDLDIANNSYEFQYNVSLGDTNLDVQNKIVRLVNNSDVGLDAEISVGDLNRTAIKLTSKQTGIQEDSQNIFNISSSKSYKELNLLGIDKVSQEPSNSTFKLNGTEHSSMSNTFTINNEFQVTLNDVTGGDVHVGFKANTDSLTDSVSEMLNAYNNFIAVGEKYSSAHNSGQLYRDISSIANALKDDLQSIGITQDERGFLSADKAILSEASADLSSNENTFSTLNHFKASLQRAADKTDIDPLKYVDKLLVEYKNPGKNFNAVYASSIYAGMMLDKQL